MKWQDLAIALAQTTFMLSLIPLIRRHSTLPLTTTSISALASCVMLVTMGTLGLWLAAGIALIKTLLWCILTAQSYQAEHHR